MKNIYKISFVALATFSLASCNDYLKYESLGTTVTVEQKAAAVEADPSKLSASVTAISSAFTPYGAIFGEDYHSDFGYPAVMMFMDHRGTDLISLDTGYNWFSSSLLYEDVLSTSDTPRLIWGTIFNQIYAANAVVATGDPNTEDSLLQYYLGQAYALRAFDYFTLAQLYSYTYVGHGDDLCVPIITEKNQDKAASEGIARSTVNQTYDQILSDINTAVKLLDATSEVRADKRYINAAVAHALRARIYMVMNKWSEALEDAQTALALASAEGLAPSSLAEASRPAFKDCSEHNWMWGVVITDKDRVSTTGICNFASHMGSLNYGYATAGAWRLVSKKLYASIPATDVRQGWFLDGDCLSKNLTKDELAYLSGSSAPAYTQVKFAPHDKLGTSNNANHVPLMRVEELYLMIAECEAMSGTGNPVETLEAFVNTYRDPSFKCLSSGAKAIQDEVWQQRRIEFFGEGLSYFDLMRLKKGIDRCGHGFPATGVFVFEPESPELRFPIPHSEEQYNKLIVNNPAVAQPQPVPDKE